MSFPGSNILDDALEIIDTTFVQWHQFQGRVTNAIGNQVSTYAAPVTIQGSFQAADRTLILNLGLNLESTYFTFYTSNNLVDIERDISGDQLVVNGSQYQCETITPWFMIDGWVEVICRYVGPSSF